MARGTRLAKHRRADRAGEVVGLDWGGADRAGRSHTRELLLQRLQLGVPRANVGDRLRRPEEEVDDRADEGRHQPEQIREEPGEAIPDPAPRILVHPVREREPEDDGEDDGDVAGDGEAGRLEEIVDPRHESHIPCAAGGKRRGSRRSYHRVVAELRTERLLLRQWRDDDLEPFAALNADPETMRFFPEPPSRAASDALAEHARRHIEGEGWGLWAVEVVAGASFIGFVGLSRPSFEEHFTPAVEVGWRLAREHWGHGYATEAGRAAVDHGFEEVGLDEIVSFTSELNEPSWRVMERLGMSHDPADDFEHPRVPVGHPLRPHVLYRLSHSDWAVSRAAS